MVEAQRGAHNWRAPDGPSSVHCSIAAFWTSELQPLKKSPWKP